MSLGNPTLGDLTTYERIAVRCTIMAVDAAIEDTSEALSESFCTLDDGDRVEAWVSELGSLSCLLDLARTQVGHALAVLEFATDRLTPDVDTTDEAP